MKEKEKERIERELRLINIAFLIFKILLTYMCFLSVSVFSDRRIHITVLFIAIILGSAAIYWEQSNSDKNEKYFNKKYNDEVIFMGSTRYKKIIIERFKR